jgi:N-acetylglucosamine-6-phosphate deacetylase
MNRIKIFNAQVITPYRIIENGSILIENGKIKRVCAGNIATDNCQEIDAKGCYAAPGFIDIHTHGGGGHDFMDGTVDAFIKASETHARHGTTALLPTTVACTFDELKEMISLFKEAKRRNKIGAEMLGLHLEGPYFSMNQKGAQDPKYIKNPDVDEYSEILSWTDDIIRWSSAPELEGALELGNYLRTKGVLPAIAHSDATYEQVLEAFESGYTHVTHLYSGMSGVRRIKSYRHAGVIESAFLIDGMTVEIIADGCHLPASLLKLIYKIKGSDKIALITDSMRAAGMPEGESILGSLKNGQKVIIEEGVAKTIDLESFAGSVATTDRLVRTMVNLADVPVTEAVRMMTATPASIIGMDDRKGSLSPGKDADIVIFDDFINIQLTMVGGTIVHRK